MSKRFRWTLWAIALLSTGSSIVVLGGVGVARTPVESKLVDFFQPGSQPSGDVVYEGFRTSTVCSICHLETESETLEIQARWQGSMMAHSARDPLFYACLTIANQDAEFAGDLCIRCHSPGGWLEGRSEPTDGSALISPDRDGVSCSVCHRMVDPVFKPGVSPPDDFFVLEAIDPLPVQPGGGNFIMDPFDVRRGPYSDAIPPHAALPSPYHRSAAMCGTCHDVSNPMYERQKDGSYSLTTLGQPHPTGATYDQFPLERTYSEWLHSEFAETGVDMKGRFGGLLTVVRTCQNCHMPVTGGHGCALDGYPNREDLAAHDLVGGNAWVPLMVANLYPGEANPTYLEEGRQRAISMLQRAATLTVAQHGNHVGVRVTNETGHKLPSGYPEGRRMWLNFVAYDESLGVLLERGHYEPLTAALTTLDTKVYETILGMNEAVSALTGLPAGKGFHFALNNMIVKDNRIPPRGFSIAAFREIQAAPVATTYLNGQFWDDTRFRLPDGATSVTINLYYQTASAEYITFLRDENRTNDDGDVLYEQWELTGKSEPVLMATASIPIDPFPIGDYNLDTSVDLIDYRALYEQCLTAPGVPYSETDCARLDFDADGDADLRDFAELTPRFNE